MARHSTFIVAIHTYVRHTASEPFFGMILPCRGGGAREARAPGLPSPFENSRPFFLPSARGTGPPPYPGTGKLAVTCSDRCSAPVHFLVFGYGILSFSRATTLLLAPNSVPVQINLVLCKSTAYDVNLPPKKSPKIPQKIQAHSTRWSSTLSSKVNLPHVINARAKCGASLVT